MKTKNTESKAFITPLSGSAATRLKAGGVFSMVWVCLAGSLQAAGTMTLQSSGDQPLQIQDHHVSVTINNGFARTEATQTFFNPNAHAVEGLYTFPVPRHGSLSEVTIFCGELELQGEVVENEVAEAIYETEISEGNKAGLTQKDGYRDFEFWIAPIAAQDEVKLKFVYYEPLILDHGVGRYVYPLEEGGTDEVIPQFWSRNSAVQGNFSIDVELKSAWPVAGIRTPGFATSNVDKESGILTQYQSAGGSLNKDFVFYYRLQDNLPGRIEVVPYKSSKENPGTFMMIVTPGVDLKPLNQGSDYIFVLDVSGSMEGKLGVLVSGVKKTLKNLRPEDRFRIIVFNQESRELTRNWVSAAVPEQVAYAMKVLDGTTSGGSTNLYAGLKRGLKIADSDRVTSFILVTDGVANQGIVQPKEFGKLMSSRDIRFFGFLLGNQSNWPLMETVCQASGGYYTGVSNSDDIIGQIQLAKSKVRHESIHDFDMKIRGVDTFDVSSTRIKKVLRGQQLVFFGRYAAGGEARLEIDARISGQKKSYTTSFRFPEVDTANPELERLWALNRIEALEQDEAMGRIEPSESESAITGLAIQYQLVTDYTSMLALTDEQFERHGIERRNIARTDLERAAQQTRILNPVANYRVDRNQPAFQHNAPSSHGGAGAISPWFALILAGFLLYGARKTFQV